MYDMDLPAALAADVAAGGLLAGAFWSLFMMLMTNVVLWLFFASLFDNYSAERAKAAFAPVLAKAGFGAITTEILPAPEFYYAEAYHQQYLAKNPNGYCGLGGTGVSCPIGTGASAA